MKSKYKINKPRGNKKYLVYTLLDIYHMYAKERKDWDSLLPYSKWKKVAVRLLWLIAYSMIRDNLIFQPPGNMGKFGIIKSNSKLRKINWQESIKRKRKIYYQRLTSVNWIFKYKWRKVSKSRMRNVNFYEFKPWHDKRKREIGKCGLAAYIKELKQDPYRRDFDALEVIVR